MAAKTEAAEAPKTFTTCDGRTLPLKTAYEYDERGELVRPAAYLLDGGVIRVEA